MRQLKISQQITQRDSIAMNKYLQEIGTIPLLTIEEEQSLPAKIKEGDARALKRFTEANLRFVVSVAKQHQANFPGEKLEDLVGAGNIGLIQAAYKFDVSRGFKFISYAVWWIRQSILQHGAENAKQIRLPLNKITLVNKVKRATNYLEQNLQRIPSADEVAEHLNTIQDREKSEGKIKEVKYFTESDVEEIMAIGGFCSSLDAPVGEEGETTTMHNITPGECSYDINKKLNQEDLVQCINKAMDKLSPREKEVVNRFYGINGYNAITLDEIGDVMDLTRERVRQIKVKALLRLKIGSKSKDLTMFL